MATKREFLTTNEVAQTLGISPFTIRRYIHLRKLKAVKLEGSYRVRRAALKEFLLAREMETEEELDAMDEEEEKRTALPKKSKSTAALPVAKKLSRAQPHVRTRNHRPDASTRFAAHRVEGSAKGRAASRNGRKK